MTAALSLPPLPPIGTIRHWCGKRFRIDGYDGDHVELTYLDADPTGEHRWEAGDGGRLRVTEFLET